MSQLLHENLEQVRQMAYRQGSWFAYVADINCELDAALRLLRHIGPDNPCAKFLTRTEERWLIEILVRVPLDSDMHGQIVNLLFLNYALFAVGIVKNFDLSDIKDRALTSVDLIQEANLGILRAIEKYDPTKKCSLATYVKYWVRGMLLMLFRGYKPVGRLTGLERVEYNDGPLLYAKSREISAALERRLMKYFQDKLLVDIFVLRHYNGLALRQIAETYDLELRHVNYLERKARTKLAGYVSGK